MVTTKIIAEPINNGLCNQLADNTDSRITTQKNVFIITVLLAWTIFTDNTHATIIAIKNSVLCNKEKVSNYLRNWLSKKRQEKWNIEVKRPWNSWKENISLTLIPEINSAHQNVRVTRNPKMESASLMELRNVNPADLKEISQLKKEKKTKNYVLLSADQSIIPLASSMHIPIIRRKLLTKNYLINLEKSL